MGGFRVYESLGLRGEGRQGPRHRHRHMHRYRHRHRCIQRHRRRHIHNHRQRRSVPSLDRVYFKLLAGDAAP